MTHFFFFECFVLQPENIPRTKQRFEKTWNFANCIGAIDGKHVEIKKPSVSGPYYFNNKKTFTVFMMAIVNYDFMMVEVGTNGRVSDAGVFAHTIFKQIYGNEELNIPRPEKIPLGEKSFLYVYVADDAFPLLENLMKHYSR